MTNPSRPSVPAMLAVLAFAVLSLLGGWLIAYGGGFHHSPGKYSADARFYSGGAAVLMASLQFLASALAFTWLLRQRVARPVSALLAFTLVFGPPLLFVLVR